ncbi:hypothetical protein IFM89_030675 [Coptis chinensis]|uniref:non-specific serine/threonine protein kinase n=1 Tax=Coptis chinensis TaxID=261450 RepID=A0A835IY98_9MAGN|nr:hypothetical protein IFM89_030675 [Coptis chinensis]
MKNGCLERFLFGSSRLGWFQRTQIALGIARGLEYLHEACVTQIIHCDIKPHNILLDDSYVARISDFGLAKLLKSNQTRTTTGIRGTKGHVAPEWFKAMPITTKVDVYSFGIMLLETKELHLLVLNDEEAKYDGNSLERLVMVALWCIQEEPSLRPSMKQVTRMLDGAEEVLIPPDPSPFITSIS